MNKARELIQALAGFNTEKSVIVIIEGNTYHVKDVYAWDDVSERPEDAPIELILDM